MATSDTILSPESSEGLRTLEYESDHRAVEIVIRTGGLRRTVQPEIFDFNRLDRNRFNGILARDLPPHELPTNRNASLEEIDATILRLNTIFKTAMEESIPKFSSRSRGLLKLPDTILHLITEKKRLRRALQRTPDPGRCLILKADLRNLDKIIQGAIAVFEEKYWTDYLSKIRVGNRTFRQVKRCAGILKRVPLPDIIDTIGTIHSDDRVKAEVLANRFSEIHNRAEDRRSPPFVENVLHQVASLNGHEPYLHFGGNILADGSLSRDMTQSLPWDIITPSDVGHALRKRANKRSSGNDCIPDFVLKKTNAVAWRFLAILFNHCMNIGYFPLQWKNAIIIPVLKPRSNPTRVENYRPISLLPAFGKLFESFLLSAIRQRITDRGILKDGQFGFRRGLSTSHALMVFTDYVARGLNNRYPTIAVSLDVVKAFDTVWQEGIIYKMMHLGFDRVICRMVADFLRSRSFRVRVGEEISDSKPIFAGVPQGSLLGPVLYNIFISDIPLPTDGDLLLIYADDILVATRGPRARTLNNRMNTYLGTVNEYFRKWGLCLNIGKTDSIMIKGKRGRLYKNCRSFIPSLSIGGDRILTSDRLKYLGVTFHEKFEFYRHIDSVLARVKGTFHLYHGLIGRKVGLSVRVRLLIYRQVIRPLMSYAFPVWFGISSHQMERLRAWERRILTSCLGLFPRILADGSFRRPSCKTIYNNIDFGRIDAYLMNLAIRFLERSSSLENSLVMGCFTGSPSLETLLGNRYLSPVDLLTLRDGNLLYGSAGLQFYHRRINSFNIHDTVYNTEQ